jgi:hypothetical protein
MFTVTIPRPDVTIEQVTDALRQGLAARYKVLPGMEVSLNPVGSPRPDDPDMLVVGTGSARLLHAQVKLLRQSGSTILHVTPGGAVPTLRLRGAMAPSVRCHHARRGDDGSVPGPSPLEGRDLG